MVANKKTTTKITAKNKGEITIRRLTSKRKKSTQQIDLRPTVLDEIGKSETEEKKKKSDVRSVKHKKVKPRKETLRDRPLSLYRKISLSFISLTAILLIVIFYFSFVKVNVVLIPKQERISSNLLIDVYKDVSKKSRKDIIEGVVKEIEVEEAKVFEATGIETTGEEVFGRAVIVNNYSKSQPLVATTRLLTLDNKLYRIKDTVDVPAGGRVEVDIYADSPSLEMVVDNEKFIIPGLWAGLQDKIYAETLGPTKYNKITKKYIQQIDLDQGAKNIKESLIKKAKVEIGGTYQEYDQKLYQIDKNSITLDVSGKVGEKRENFTISAKAQVAVVAFDADKIKEMARQKLVSSLSDDKELISFEGDKISYNLDNFNLKQETAAINIMFEGQTSYKTESSIVEREKLLGLTAEQLEGYLSSLTEIDGFEYKFHPSFIKKVPNLVDRVNIEVKNK